MKLTTFSGKKKKSLKISSIIRLTNDNEIPNYIKHATQSSRNENKRLHT